MWLFVFFDLPVETKKQKKAYRDFHNFLLKDGFFMFQYSVYARHAVSIEVRQVHLKRVEDRIPKEGKVSILTVTDKQYELIRTHWGVERKPPPNRPRQLELF